MYVGETVAVITDIHANRPALDAVMARIADLRIDTVYCGGDLVGYGPTRTKSASSFASSASKPSTATTTTPSAETYTTVGARIATRTTARSDSSQLNGR